MEEELERKRRIEEREKNGRIERQGSEKSGRE